MSLESDLDRCDHEIKEALRLVTEGKDWSGNYVGVDPRTNYLGLCDWRKERELILKELNDIRGV